jgi:2,3-bisphosphoglycerate-dependent phosphoglycerate mutase
VAETRVYVARHGEAAYETQLITDDGGTLTELGRSQAAGLAAELAADAAGNGITHVWTSSRSRAVQTAEIAAGALGCDVTVREGLREFGVGAFAGQPQTAQDPLAGTFFAWLDGDLDVRIDGGESGTELAARVRAVLEEVAGSHPGESVLVISHGGAMGVGLPALAANLPSDIIRLHPLPNCGVVELTAQSADWRAVRWLDRAVDD